MNYIDVLLPVASEGVYTYEGDAPAGMRVNVPLGRRSLVGISLGKVAKPDFACRPAEALDEYPLFPPLWLEFIKKLAAYYTATPGLALHGVLSSKLLASFPPDSLETISNCEVESVCLSSEQQKIVDSVDLTSYSTHLLHGITGSGKTEIYLELAKKVMAEGRKVIYLVPEISLTPQLLERISQRLGFEPALFHSRLTDKKRALSFWAFSQGRAPILVGARSALFVPVENPGLIIVDEEHENTYKQEESPAYNLRDMAVLYASIWGIPVILGSATPQVESVYNSRTSKYSLHRLKSRPGEAVLADIDMVDLRKSNTVGGIMAEPIYDELARTLAKGKQAILFLNRKGYATSLYCNSCGALQECVNCSVPLTMYKTGGRVSCHYCGSAYASLRCSACGSGDIRDAGAGTERVEEFIEQMFPGKAIRIDADKITSIKQLDTAIKTFSEKKAQILIGTQLVAKGLHFPNVTFVGIMGIDNIISLPDFRATEKAYQLMMQVSGRAGRGADRGSVYIQSLLPEHPLFNFVMNDADAFYDYELERRRLFSYPPYVKLSRLIFSYPREGELIEVAGRLAIQLRVEFPKAFVTDAVPAPIYKIKNLYRLSVLIKTKSSAGMSVMLKRSLELFEISKKGSMGMKLDRDPYFFM